MRKGGEILLLKHSRKMHLLEKSLGSGVKAKLTI
jgi:hypothetical protein